MSYLFFLSCKKSHLPLALSLTFLLLNSPLLAQESIDFNAEHILEVPMDFAYLALPQKPTKGETEEWRVGYSYADTSASGIKAKVPMLTLHYYSEFEDKSGFSVGAFFQKYQFSANPQSIIVSPNFAALTAYPQTFNANLTQVSGSANHYGVSFGYYFDFEQDSHLQIGLLIEGLQVSQFKVDFVSQGFPIDFLGSIDYAASYNAITPYATYQFSEDQFADWTGTLRAIFAKPLPRVGFVGSFSTSSYQVSGDSKSYADVTPIPDSYLGMGYTLENSNGFRVDLGALVYSYIFEPYGHTGFDSPIFLSFSNSF